MNKILRHFCKTKQIYDENINFYKLLNVDINSDYKTIKNAYYAEVKIHHPDKA